MEIKRNNIDILPEIDGHERKFVIGKNKNLSSAQLKDMVEKYFSL